MHDWSFTLHGKQKFLHLNPEFDCIRNGGPDCRWRHPIYSCHQGVAGNLGHPFCLVVPGTSLWSSRDFHRSTSRHSRSLCLILLSKRWLGVFSFSLQRYTHSLLLRWSMQGARHSSCKIPRYHPKSASCHSKGSSDRHAPSSHQGTFGHVINNHAPKN